METQLHDEWTWSTWGTGASGLGALFGPLLLAAVGLAITWWQYRRERARWQRQPWRLACGLRCLVWLLLAFILLGPGWQRVEQREVKPPVVVLRDVSRSMSVADPVRADEAGAALARFWHVPLEELQRAPPTRAATVERALAGQDQPIWRALQLCGVPRLIDFDQGTRRVVWERNGAGDVGGDGEVERAGAWPVGRPEGRGTDLTAALRTALEGEPPAAIVLLSDGRHTGRDDPREVAREAGERQIPIVAVEVGETQRQTSARVVGVHARPRVWQDEPFEIEALLAATAAPSRQLTVALWRRSWDESGSMAEEQLEEAVCPLGDAAVPVRQVFTRREVTAGRYQYEVRVSPLAGELDLEDNRRVSPPVTVLERDRLRVLVIAGEPTWEFRHVERWLAQDETLQSSCWLQSAEEERQATGTRPLDALPATFEELQWYDVLLLLDPDADRLPDAWGEWIRRFLVEHGGGVLYQAGPSFTAGWQSRAVARGLQDVWPVELAGTAELELAGRVSSAPRGWPVRPVAAARDHPLLADWREVGGPPRLAASPAAAVGAARLPVVFWSCPVRRIRPAARVLWEHSDPALGLTAGASAAGLGALTARRRWRIWVLLESGAAKICGIRRACGIDSGGGWCVGWRKVASGKGIDVGGCRRTGIVSNWERR
ncbi:MAG: vWA domain-containing protein [Pirellulales bacterium]